MHASVAVDHGVAMRDIRGAGTEQRLEHADIIRRSAGGDDDGASLPGDDGRANEQTMRRLQRHQQVKIFLEQPQCVVQYQRPREASGVEIQEMKTLDRGARGIAPHDQREQVWHERCR